MHDYDWTHKVRERYRPHRDTPHPRRKRRNHRSASPREEGEIPEKVQVTVFDPDEFLERLEQHQFDPQCPRCQVPMKYGSASCPDGKTYKYYRCPTKNWGTKCYVTCAVNEVGDYLIESASLGFSIF